MVIFVIGISTLILAIGIIVGYMCYCKEEEENIKGELTQLGKDLEVVGYYLENYERLNR